MSKIVAMGPRGFVVALAGIGAEPVRCDDEESFGEALRKVALDKDVHLVFAPEPMLVALEDGVANFRKRSPAALLGLPLRPSDEHPSLDTMRHLIEQATGASLI